MAIGIATGKTIGDYGERKGETFKIVAEFLEKCEGKFGSVDCRTLCDLDLTTEEGLNKLISNGVKDKTCLPLVKEVAGMLHEELLRVMSGRR